MSDKKILNEEELEEVSGGKDMDAYLPANHGRHIGKYEAEGYIGQKVYVVRDIDRECYYWGTLVNSFEDKKLFCTERMHDIKVEGCNNYFSTCKSFVGHKTSFSGDLWTLFLMN